MFRLFANLSIRSKVIFAFTLVFVETVGLGLFTVHRLDAATRVAEDLRSDWLPGIRDMGDMARFAERLRGDQIQLVIATGQDRARRESEAKRQAALFDETFRRHHSTVVRGASGCAARSPRRAWRRSGRR